MGVQQDSTANIGATPAEVAVPRTAAGREGESIEGVLVAWADTAGRREPGAPAADGLPVLSAPAAGDDAEVLRGHLRRFHIDDSEAASALEIPDDGFLPALLQPFRDPTRVRHDYPVVLVPAGQERNGRVAAPLGELLGELTRAIAPESDEARMLEDNLPRLERCVRETLDGSAASVDAAKVLSSAARLTEESLSLRGESGRRFHEDLEKLVAAVPAGGSLLPLGAHTPLLLYLHVACDLATRRRSALRAEVDGLRNRLRDLLRLEQTTHPGADQPRALASSLGGGQAYIDSEALARVVGSAGHSDSMSPERRDRIDEAIRLFEQYLAGKEGPLVVVVHYEAAPEHDHGSEVEWHVVDRAAVCREGTERFDDEADRYAALLGALRLARLELDGAYEPTRHDRLRDSFDWRSFTQSELLALPPVLALESAEHLAGAGMIDLSRLLRSGRPVDVLVTVQPATNPGVDADEDPLAGYRFELAYLGVSHREAMVNQTSAARPDHLMTGFRRGLATTRAALHVVASGLQADGRDPPLGSWLHGGAALEGRAHPLFHYDPEAGATWARRFDFSTNPQPEVDWPTYTLPCRSESGERQDLTVAFTFADFALMERCFRRHFRVVPPEVTAEEIVPLDDYLSLPPDQTHDRIPYIHAVDGRNRVQRLAITRRLAFACRDRLDYWRTLQELSGARNEYVREAVERQSEELAAEFAAERDALSAAHAAAVEQARTEAAGEAMRRLSEALLATDVSALAAEATAAPPPTAPSVPAGADEPTAVEPDAAAEPALDAAPAESETEEPWIDTVLCTSCNDCLEINPRIFIYNANKQAVIGDPRAGTFDELVRAAEKCPARCIHPGTPLDPEEPNLDALVERAKPFNV